MAEAEEELFCGLLPLQEQIVVNRNNRKLAKWSLRHQCLKTVVRNRDIFTNVGPNSAHHQVDNLPLVLRSELMDMVEEIIDREYSCSFQHHPLVVGTSIFDSYCRFKARLLQGDTATLNLTLSLDEVEQTNSLENLLEEVGRKNCRSLRLINVNGQYEMYDDEVLHENLLVVHAFFRALPRLVNLQVVKIGPKWCVEDHQLKEFAKHTPNLVVLIADVQGDKVSSAGFEALSKLPHFRKFIFNSGAFDADFERQHTLMLCAQFLPKLKVVGSDFADLNYTFIELHEYDSVHYYRPIFHRSIVQEPQPVPLGLEQIFLAGNVKPHQSCQLPDLRNLIWMNPSGELLGFCNHFSTITELTLFKADVDLMMLVLQGVGRRLTKLELGLVPRAIPISQMLQFCPKLEYLRIEYCTFESCARWPASEDFCTSLQEFSLLMWREPLPRGFIVKLLGAPQLKKLSLSETYLSKYEVDELLVLVRQRRILFNIVEFDWHNEFSEKYQEEWWADKDHFNLLLDNIQMACPHLATINFLKRSDENVAEIDAEYEKILHLVEDEENVPEVVGGENVGEN